MKHWIVAVAYLSIINLQSAFAIEKNNIQEIRIAATTSIENSGLLKYLLPVFSKDHPYTFKTIIVGSGKALRLGRTGEIDMIWVHSPKSEEKFVSEGYGLKRHTIMRNDFVLAGPEDDPAKINSANDVFEALSLIANTQQPFISRADDSGTNKKELSLWKRTKLDPYGMKWYVESGSGMATTLALAEDKKAYLLIDKATFIVRNKNTLKILLEDPTNLTNPYSVIAVNPKNHAGVNSKAVYIFINWLLSADGKKAIANYQHNNQQLFYLVNEK